MDERRAFYNVLEREIDNLCRINPILAFLSTPLKQWLVKALDPYLQFFMTGDRIQTNMAEAFIKDEVAKKIADFKTKFNKEIILNEDEKSE